MADVEVMEFAPCAVVPFVDLSGTAAARAEGNGDADDDGDGDGDGATG